jgi:putative ABC transport system substrate-binding protein
MDRRAFLGTLAGGIVGAPLAAEAQPAGRVYRIGYLSLQREEGDKSWVAAFRQGLRELGYVEGRNVAIEQRHAAGRSDRLPELASELVRLKIDVLVVYGLWALIDAGWKAPGALPMVFTVDPDPVGRGLVKSLARPGGNITGLVTLSATLNSKRCQLLKEAFPRISRVAYLDSRPSLQNEIEAAASSLALTLLLVKIDTPEGFEQAFAEITKQRVDALFVNYAPFFWEQRSVIIEFAARQRLPAIYPFDVYPKSGGLMSYGVKYTQLYRRAATYVDKLLKGARPSELPIEQPAAFELWISLKTAKALGLTIPQSLLQRADEVIQ